MVPLKTELARKCEGYFPGVADTALLSALQGYMGFFSDAEHIDCAWHPEHACC